MHIKATLLALVLVILTACAGDPASSQLPIIEYYGDSTIWGFKSNTNGERVATSAPTTFVKLLPNFVVYNEGVSATTACQLLNGEDRVHPSWHQQMTQSKAQFIIINHGINDAWSNDIASYQHCLTRLYEIAKAAGKQVIFETPNPTMQAQLSQFIKVMTDLAKTHSIPVIDQFDMLNNKFKGQDLRTFIQDGIHPNDDIYLLKGEYAAQEFIKLLAANVQQKISINPKIQPLDLGKPG